MNSSNKKPPIGIMPRRFHREARRQAILDACREYCAAGKQIPAEWLDEFVDLCTELERQRARVQIERYQRKGE